MDSQNQAYARARLQNFAAEFPAYRNVAEILVGAIEGGADAVGQALTALRRIAEGFALLYQKRTISFDVTLALRKREAEVIGLLVAGAIAEADVSRTLEGARDLVEQLEAAGRTREQARAVTERAAVEQRHAVEAERLGVGEILAAVETNGMRLGLQGDQIVVRGGSLNDRQRIFVNTRRRHLIEALRGRDHQEAV